jgi:hypothetical protein
MNDEIFLNALLKGDISKIKSCLEKGASLCEEIPYGLFQEKTGAGYWHAQKIYPFEIAFLSNHPQCIHFLLDMKAPIQKEALYTLHGYVDNHDFEGTIGTPDALRYIDIKTIYEKQNQDEWLTVFQRLKALGVNFLGQMGYGNTMLHQFHRNPFLMNFILDQEGIENIINQGEGDASFTMLEQLHDSWHFYRNKEEFFKPYIQEQLDRLSPNAHQYLDDINKIILKAFSKGASPLSGEDFPNKQFHPKELDYKEWRKEVEDEARIYGIQLKLHFV